MSKKTKPSEVTQKVKSRITHTSTAVKKGKKLTGQQDTRKGKKPNVSGNGKGWKNRKANLM